MKKLRWYNIIIVITKIITISNNQMIRSTGSGISHCPNSNFSLKSGVCNVQRLRRAGVKVCSEDDHYWRTIKGELYGRYICLYTSPTGGSGNRLLRRFLSISLGRNEAGGHCLQRGPFHWGGGGAIVLQVSILPTRSCLPWDCLLGWQFLGRQYIKDVPKKWLPEFSRMTVIYWLTTCQIIIFLIEHGWILKE